MMRTPTALKKSTDPMSTTVMALVTSDPVIQWFVVGGTFSHTSQRIRPLIFGSILSKSGQLILVDVRSIAHDAVTDISEATDIDLMFTLMTALVTNDSVSRGRGHVQSHFSANSTIDFWIDFV